MKSSRKKAFHRLNPALALILALVGLLAPLLVWTSSSATSASTGNPWSWGVKNGPATAAGDSNYGATPVEVASLTNAIALAGDVGGDAWSWGLNAGGQVGDGTVEVRNAPTKVRDIVEATSVAGGLAHSLAVQSDGTVRAWGNNDLGQLGNGTNDASLAPVAAVGLDHVIAVAAGFDHSVALKMDGTVWSWGGNKYAQLGNGTTIDSPMPVHVASLDRITEVAAAGYHNLARRSDGTVWIWGTPGLGGAGYENSRVACAPTPVQLSSPPGVTDVAAGIDHDLMLKDGSVYSWGINQYGQLGDGSANSRLSGFTQAKGLKDVTAIAAGSYHSLALTKDGKVHSWGWNESGQLGNGTTTNSAVPVDSKTQQPITVIAAGWYHNLAIASDGSLWAWGDNLYGKLGDGTFRLSVVPKKIEGFGPVIDVSAGADHSLAIKGPSIPIAVGTSGTGGKRVQPATSRPATRTQ